MVLLLTCLLWPLHLPWPTNVWCSNTFVWLVPCLSFCDQLLWYMPLALACVYLLLSLLEYHVLLYTLAGPLLSLPHWYLCWGLISLYLYSLCSCVMIANLQWTACNLSDIVCTSCTDVCVELYIAGVVIMLLHLCPLQLPLVCGLWWHVLHMQNGSNGTSLSSCAGSQVLLSIVIPSLSTR